MKLASVQGEPAKPSKAVSRPNSDLIMPDGLGHVLEAITEIPGIEPSNIIAVAHDEIHFDPAAFAEAESLAQRFRHDQNVTEQNGRVKMKSAHRLQRHFRGQIGNLDQLAEGEILFEGAILRQATPRLAHQPDGRAIHRQAVQRIQHSFSLRAFRQILFRGPDCALRLSFLAVQ